MAVHTTVSHNWHSTCTKTSLYAYREVHSATQY